MGLCALAASEAEAAAGLGAPVASDAGLRAPAASFLAAGGSMASSAPRSS